MEQATPPEQAFYEKQKAEHGRNATFLWIAIGVFVFQTEPTARLWSWKAAAFFTVGLFSAAIVFGAIGYGIQRLVAKVLARRQLSVPRVGTIGLLLLMLDAVIVYFAARWAVRLMFPPLD
jgi:hypothetical protein